MKTVKGDGSALSARSTSTAAPATSASLTPSATSSTSPYLVDPPSIGGRVVPGGLIGLNPADGLFLRAEHLQVMQDYGRDLARAVGVASGTGVVYGYSVSLDGRTHIHVTSGLAINGQGEPLRSNQTASLSLEEKGDDLPAYGADDYLLLEVLPAFWNQGQENAYGNLCGDTCAGSEQSIKPWMYQGVQFRLTAHTMKGLGDRVLGKRNWLASHYFEEERSAAKPWLRPPGFGFAGASRNCQVWSDGQPAPGSDAVPLAVVFRVEDIWVVDVWTARRQIGEPPDETAWMWRVGMRPRNVFWAQVLQFEQEFCSVLDSIKRPTARQRIVDFTGFVDDVVADAIKLNPAFDPGALTEALNAAVRAQGETGRPSLQEMGFDELPPAGYLAGLGSGDALEASIDALFNESVDWRICEVRPDYVPRAVEHAQHLDRIPLDIADGDKPHVDILVPSLFVDLEAMRSAGLDWVAFVRRSEASCDESKPDEPNPDTDEVALYYIQTTTKMKERVAENGELPDPQAAELGSIRYLAGTDDEIGSHKQVPLVGRLQTFVYFVASDEGLGQLRADKLREEMGRGGTPKAIAEPTFTEECIIVVQVVRSDEPQNARNLAATDRSASP